MPKSVLCYLLDKVRYFGLGTYLINPVLFSQIKRLMDEIRVKQLIWFEDVKVFEANTHFYYIMKYWRNW